MGRGKAPEPPAFQPSETRYGDTTVSKTYVDPTTGGIVTEYIPDPVEEQQKALTQQKINQIVSNLGKTAPELIAEYQKTEKAFTNNAKQNFLQEYNPALRELREDVASRFGSLNSSQFINNLKGLEQTRANAFADIVTQAQLLKNDLVNQNESRKLNELQSLGNVLSSSQSNFLNNLQAPLSASKLLNDFNQGQWMQQLNDYRSGLAYKRALLRDALNTGYKISSSYAGH